jgi:hypothetical protein
MNIQIYKWPSSLFYKNVIKTACTKHNGKLIKNSCGLRKVHMRTFRTNPAFVMQPAFESATCKQKDGFQFLQFAAKQTVYVINVNIIMRCCCYDDDGV